MGRCELGGDLLQVASQSQTGWKAIYTSMSGAAKRVFAVDDGAVDDDRGLHTVARGTVPSADCLSTKITLRRTTTMKARIA